MDEILVECDLLVIGGGMAGLSAAGWAAERGARVTVIERAPALGGSAIMSGGVVWTAASPGKMDMYGGGDPALGRVIFDTYPEAIAWLRRRGVAMSPKIQALHGRGYQVDLRDHFGGCERLVQQHGGFISLDTTTTRLLRDDNGAVVGAQAEHADGPMTIRAAATIIATGGFQASPDMRAEFIHPQARDMLLRSNKISDGAGIKLGQAVGGEVAATNRRYYGHLVSEPDRWDDERLFVDLTQYHSEFALLLNEQGKRFCDETLGDHTNTFETMIQTGSRAICFWDTRVHSEYATVPVVSVAVPFDKMQMALDHGGKGIVAADLDRIATFADSQGFDGNALRSTIEAFNHEARYGWETLQPPRSEEMYPFDKAPFYALVVHPAITFTFGGLTIDPGAHVLRDDGSRIPGLFAAGADAGAAYNHGYAGGLAMAITFGITAARSAGWA